jgi:hypothetical protein
MARRQHITLTLVGVLLFITLTYFMSSGSNSQYVKADESWISTGHASSHGTSGSRAVPGISESILTGGSIAPKLENATIK